MEARSTDESKVRMLEICIVSFLIVWRIVGEDSVDIGLGLWIYRFNGRMDGGRRFDEPLFSPLSICSGC